MRILNVGCGDDTYGTDFIDLYPQRKNVIKCDVNKEKFPFPDNTFDEIYTSCLFEHLTNHDNFMKECYRVLKPGGRLVIITDNANYFYYTFNKTHHGGYAGYGDEDTHYGLYTTHHLKNFAKKYGFKVKETGYLALWEDIRYGRKISSYRKYIKSRNFLITSIRDSLYKFAIRSTNIKIKRLLLPRIYAILLKKP